MIGNFNVTEPAADDALVRMVESHRQISGQPYAAILMFGLAGTVDCSTEVRRYAGYRHVREHPGDGPAWLELARLHAEDGEFDAAHAILDELERLDAPALYPETYAEDLDVHRAHFWAEAGRLPEARALLEELALRHGEGVVYRYTRASVLHALGRYDDAAEAYDEALSALAEYVDADEDDGETDPAAVRAFLSARRAEAEGGQAFAAPRPWMLADLRDEG